MRIRNPATMYFQHSAAVCAVCTALAHKMTHTIKNRPHVPVGVKEGPGGWSTPGLLWKIKLQLKTQLPCPRCYNLTFCKPDVLKPDVLQPDVLKPDVLWVYRYRANSA
jgi:hypothetical protein